MLLSYKTPYWADARGTSTRNPIHRAAMPPHFTQSLQIIIFCAEDALATMYKDKFFRTWTGPFPFTDSAIAQNAPATPANSAREINTALQTGQNVLFTPGVYHLDRTIEVKRPDTVVLGMGFATFTPDIGAVAMSTANVRGVKLAGLLFDAGPVNSPVLLQVGNPHERGNDNPAGATPGSDRPTPHLCTTCSSESVEGS